MRLTARWTAVTLWLAVSVVATVACVMNMYAARIGDEYLPMGNDAFYHAARILPAVRDPAAFYEFDDKIHAPEGSLLVWPWGYDYAVAKIVRLALATGLGSDPLRTLLYVPVVAVWLGIGLMMMLARRVGLTLWPMTLAGLCMALSPTTQLLFAFGSIDHHYAELLFILTSLVTGVGWLQRPSIAAGLALGATFGAALAIHNGLFIIQVPFLATLLVRWLQGERPPTKPALAIVCALLVTALLALLPSQSFRQGQFAFYTLSWFHLYVVICSSVVIVLLTKLERTRGAMWALAALAILLPLPLLQEIKLAQSFLSGSLGTLQIILEMQSPIKLAMNGEASVVTRFYSLFIWIAPLTFVLCLAQCWRERHNARLLFWIASAGGLALLALQLRLHYFGGFALYIPWLVFAQQLAVRRESAHYKTILLLTSLTFLLAYVPQIRYALIAKLPRGGDPWFDTVHPLLLTLREACAEDPGVVLADSTSGHYIRYYTDCSVIANNFLLTEQQFRKVDEAQHLLAMSPEEFLREAPYVKYALVRAGDIVLLPNGEFSYSFFGTQDPLLSRAALFGTPSQLPLQFQLLDKVDVTPPAMSGTGETIPYGRLYKIDHSATMDTSASATSGNEVSK